MFCDFKHESLFRFYLIGYVNGYLVFLNDSLLQTIQTCPKTIFCSGYMAVTQMPKWKHFICLVPWEGSTRLHWNMEMAWRYIDDKVLQRGYNFYFSKKKTHLFLKMRLLENRRGIIRHGGLKMEGKVRREYDQITLHYIYIIMKLIFIINTC